MLYAGVDIGSVATKAVVMYGRHILGSAVRPTGSRPKIAAEMALEAVLATAGRTDVQEPVRVVSTGYGRRIIDFGEKAITEISACALGARWGDPPDARIQTLIDLGGQDIKVIRLDPSGQVSDFIMNDKCAAGTGRFLDVMAHALETQSEQLGPLALGAKKAAPITATCAVFAESEVVSLLAQGIPKEEIIAGIHAAIADRIFAMVTKLGLNERVLFCGGGAKNIGLVQALENKLKTRLVIPDSPQLLNALGSAIAASQLDPLSA